MFPSNETKLILQRFALCYTLFSKNCFFITPNCHCGAFGSLPGFRFTGS